ncbi:MAG: fumarate/nitrate reduction transcriptional regulator Fnr [Gammaproteobacteria bacterium]
MQPSFQKYSCRECKISGLCLPYGLQKHEINRLAAIVKNRRPLHIDEFLYVQGDPCQSLYAVKSGSFRSYIANSEGDEQTIGFYLPGEFMGLDSLQHGHFTCTLIALETSSVCELPLSRLNELCSEIPALQFQMMRTLGKEIAADHDKILALGHRSAKCRIAGFLLTLSRRYSALGFSGTEFSLSMRRYDIANFLGLTIETVSRQLADLNKCGIITVRQRGVRINNLDLLKSIVESNPLALAE